METVGVKIEHEEQELKDATSERSPSKDLTQQVYNMGLRH